MKRNLLSMLLLGATLLGFAAGDAGAIPVLARKYGFNCTMCHSNIPRLNDFGQLYRMNGYRLPGRENVERTVLETPAPVAFRTSVGYNGESSNAPGADVSALQLNGLDILSAGLLGRDIGYFMVYVPQMASSRGVAGQDGSLEMASVVFSHLGSNWLNVRLGRYEPAYVAFSVKRQLSVSPYEIYDAAFPGGPAYSETQTGIEISGYSRTGFQYAGGVVTGSETNHPEDTPMDGYARLAYVFGPGRGQTAGQRIGLLGSAGSARPQSGTVTGKQTFYRGGAEASLNAAHLNLALQYLYGRDQAPLWQRPTNDDDITWSGGFAELSALPRVDLVVFARYDYVDAPSIQNTDVSRATVGGRYYLEDNVALHLEYSYRTVKSTVTGQDDATLSFVTARVDLAF